MNTTRVVLLSFCALSLSCAAPPVSESESPARAAEQAPDVEEIVTVDPEPEIICVYETRTGTHRKERICYTQERIAEMSDKSKEALRTRGKSGVVYEPIHPKDPRRRKEDN